MAAPPTESQTIASQLSSSTPSQQPEDIGTRDPETLERAAKLGIVLFRTPEYFWFDPHGFEFEGF